MRTLLAAAVSIMVLAASDAPAEGLCWYDAVERNANSPYGLISWHTDLAKAQAKARTAGMPMLVLSGADTAAGRTFAKGVLSFIFTVDGAQQFVPVMTPDGKPGVQFLSNEGRKLIEDLGTDACEGQVLMSMTKALRTAECEVPEYLRMAAVQYGPADRQAVSLGFGWHINYNHGTWFGELEGIIETTRVRTGVKGDCDPSVRVTFDADVVSYSEVVDFLAAFNHVRRFVALDQKEKERLDRLLKGKPRKRALSKEEARDPSIKRSFTAGPVSTGLKLHVGTARSLERTRWDRVKMPTFGHQNLRAAMLRKKKPDGFYSPSQLRLQQGIASVTPELVKKYDLTAQAFRVTTLVPYEQQAATLNKTVLKMREQLENIISAEKLVVVKE